MLLASGVQDCRFCGGASGDVVWHLAAFPLSDKTEHENVLFFEETALAVTMSNVSFEIFECTFAVFDLFVARAGC